MSIVVVSGAAADKVGRRNTVFITRVLEISVAQVKVEDSNGVRILIGNKQVLATIVELEMAWSFTSGMKVSYSCEFPSLRSRPLYFVDSDGLMATVGNNDKTPALVYTNSPARVHEIWKGAGNSGNALYESQCGSSLESRHVLALLGGFMNFTQKVAVDFEYGNLYCVEQERG